MLLKIFYNQYRRRLRLRNYRHFQRIITHLKAEGLIPAAVLDAPGPRQASSVLDPEALVAIVKSRPDRRRKQRGD